MVRSVIVIVLALVVGVLTPIGAQQPGEARTVAVLSSGPDSRRGIELFAPDLTPFWYGRYSTQGGTVEIRYAEAPLPRTAEWLPAPCSNRVVVTDGGMHYRYADPDAQWSILVTVDGVVDVCGFIDTFVDRFLFFQRVESRGRPGQAPAFPAVLEIPSAQTP